MRVHIRLVTMLTSAPFYVEAECTWQSLTIREYPPTPSCSHHPSHPHHPHATTCTTVLLGGKNTPLINPAPFIPTSTCRLRARATYTPGVCVYDVATDTPGVCVHDRATYTPRVFVYDIATTGCVDRVNLSSVSGCGDVHIHS